MAFDFQASLQKMVKLYRATNGIDASCLADTIVFARKLSLIEYLLLQKDIQIQEGRDFAYQELSAALPNFDRAWESHVRQREVADSIRQMFPDAIEVFATLIFNRDAFAVHALSHADIVVTASGDEFVKTVAQLIGNETVLVPINSDPETSDGALTMQLNDLREGLRGDGGFSFNRNTRVEAVYQGQVLGTALDSIFIGCENRREASALTQIFPDGRKASWKCSGIVAYPGSGSTGWPLSASGSGDGQCPTLAGLEKGTLTGAAYVVSEPFRGRISDYSIASGLIQRGDKCTLESLLQSGGVLDIDGIAQPFAYGSKVIVELSDDPTQLLVTTMPKDELPKDSFLAKRIFFAHEKRVSMTRYRLTLETLQGVVGENQKSSGVYFAAASAGEDIRRSIGCLGSLPASEVFSQSAERFDVLVTEPRDATFASPLQEYCEGTAEFQARIPGQMLLFDGYPPFGFSKFELPQWERVGIRLSDRKTVTLVRVPPGTEP
jgi:hypothetical protein